MDEYELSLWEKYKGSGDKKAKEEIILKYIPLVKYIAGRIGSNMLKNIEFDDLLSYGTIGLLDAMEKFNPYRGSEFSSYAKRRIWGAIIDGLRRDDWVPRAARDRVRKVSNAIMELENVLKREPTDEEIANYLGIEIEEAKKWIMDSQRVAILSLDEVINFDEHDLEGKDVIPDNSLPSPHEVVEREDIKRVLKEEIASLSEREQRILALYYYEGLTMKEVGEVLGVSESRASQLCSRLLMKLRARLSLRLGITFKARSRNVRNK